LNEAQGEWGVSADPLYLPSYGKTIAQISTEEKNTISHRAIATRLFFKL
jgi:XTP/dITP diphosphohydrolase